MSFTQRAVWATAGLMAAQAAARAGALPNAPRLTLDPTVVTADHEATTPSAPLMRSLEMAGVGKPLEDAKLNIYGWVESGYTYNHRHSNSSSGTVIIPGPFNHEFGNHYMLNQVVIRFERTVATDKFDVGGMIELMYGSDAARIHSTGLGYNGSDATDDNSPPDQVAVDNLHPIWQFDIAQAYVTLNLPIGSGLQVMIGKFVTLLGYETIDPRTNLFYSHSFMFSAVPGTQTGILASYQLNDAIGLKLGISRGWDIALEDNNGCAIDVIGQVSYTINKQMKAVVTFNVGPENAGDPGHYRTVINSILYYQVTEQLQLGLEGLYVYDGGINGGVAPGSTTHAYGDVWGRALYASYQVNDMFTVNARLEHAHGFLGTFSGVALFDGFGVIPAVNAFGITLGTTITPFPKEPCLKGLKIRPEIRYDFTDSSAFPFFSANGTTYKDQLTFGADVIFEF